MPYRNSDLGPDERDAITADLLLKKLRAGMDNSRTESEENTKIEASQISDEAMKLAISEIIYGKPEEYEEDKLNEEGLSKYIEIADDEPQGFEAEDFEEISVDEYLENIPEEEISEEEVSEENDPEEDTDDEPVEYEPNEPVAEEKSEDSVPWFEDEQDALSATAVYSPVSDDMEQSEEEIDRIIAELEMDIDAKDGISDTVSDDKDDDLIEQQEDEGFLSQMSSMISEVEADVASAAQDEDENDEYSEFDFVENKDKADASDEYTDETEANPVLEDGSREYIGLNGKVLDTTEITLLTLFKGKEEIAEQLGEEKAQEILKESEKIQMPSSPKKKKPYEMFDSDYEYTEPEQVEEIKAKYTRRFRSVTVRFLLALVFATAVFFLENAAMLGMRLPNLLTASVYHTVCAMIDLQLVILCALMYADKLVEGFNSIIRLKLKFECVPAVLLTASVVYTAIMTLIPGARSAALYNFPVALTFVLALLCEIMDIKREVMSFSVASSGSKKYVVRKMTDEEREQDGRAFDEYVSPDAPMFAVTKVRFVDGFFARVRKQTSKGHLLVLMLITLAEVLLSVGLGLLMRSSAYEIVTMAYLAIVLGLPGTILIAGAHPFYRSSRAAYENESAIIGEGSIDEYADGSVVFFDEKDIFPSSGVKINSVKVYSDNRIDGVIYYAASIFAKIGGPLADVFSLATGEIGHSENTELVDCADNGLHCTIDGESIYLGSNDYMKSMDYETPYGESDEAMEKNNGIRLMYVANEQEILAKFYVQYTADSEYELIIKQLYKAGMCIGIRTRDPNIDEEFVARKLRLSLDYPVRVVRSKPGKEMPAKLERVDSGIVASNVKPLLRALSACDRIKYISKIHSIFEIVSTVLVMVVIYAVAALGKLGLGSAYAALYQLFWLIPIMFVAIFTD